MYTGRTGLPDIKSTYARHEIIPLIRFFSRETVSVHLISGTHFIQYFLTSNPYNDGTGDDDDEDAAPVPPFTIPFVLSI